MLGQTCPANCLLTKSSSCRVYLNRSRSLCLPLFYAQPVVCVMLCSASAGTSPPAASAQPADQQLQLLWSQLSAVKTLSVVGSAKFLHIGSGACFPQEGTAVQGRLFIRQCYLDLADLLEQHLVMVDAASSSQATQVSTDRCRSGDVGGSLCEPDIHMYIAYGKHRCPVQNRVLQGTAMVRDLQSIIASRGRFSV